MSRDTSGKALEARIERFLTVEVNPTEGRVREDPKPCGGAVYFRGAPKDFNAEFARDEAK